MIRSILVVALIAGGLSSAAIDLHDKHVPEITPTAVIAEKPEKQVGGQVAVLQPTNLSEKQKRLMKLAADFGEQEGLSPELVQGVLLVETNAGQAKSYRVANPGPNAYFGAMQIKLVAAKDVLKSAPHLYEKYGFQTRTDDEIKAHLILNESFNIEVGTKYIKWLKDTYKLAGRELVNAFNRGAGGVKSVDSDTYYYAITAEQKVAAWKSR